MTGTDQPPTIDDPQPSRFAAALTLDGPGAVAIWVLGALGWLITVRRVFRGYVANT